MSALADLVAPENPQNRRAREWRERRRAKLVAERYADQVRFGLVSAAEAAAELAALTLASAPEPVCLVAQPDPPAPRTCRWIRGEHLRFVEEPCFCGQASLPGLAWCQEHVKRVFRVEE